MKTLKLELTEHDKKRGSRCDYIPPTVTESCLLEYDGKIIGFYLTELPDKLKQYITIANKEQSDLAVAPSQSSAPKPALKDEDTKVMNGTVEKMRLAYVPVAQRKGLKRRWNMPGGKILNDESSTTTDATTTTLTKGDDSTPSQKRTRAEQEADMVVKAEGEDNVVSVVKSSKKSSSKKSKKKKSRKSK